MPLLDDDFVPALGLEDPHAQAVFAKAVRLPRVPGLRRERRETPDGDFVDVDVLPGVPGRWSLLVLHGLEGSSEAGYVREVLRLCALRGWGAVAMNFRGCSGTPNRKARLYCSGDYPDAALCLTALPRPRAAVGFSLGGCVIINLLAREPSVELDAAVGISVPFDLAASARWLDSGAPFSRVYRRGFLDTMKQKALMKALHFPERFDAERIRGLTSVRDFDEVITAPTFGFADAEDYYRECCPGRLLGQVRTPTLLISAQDDQMAPAADAPGDLPRDVELLATRRGGHVGFVSGSVLRPRYYAEERAVDWLARRA